MDNPKFRFKPGDLISNNQNVFSHVTFRVQSRFVDVDTGKRFYRAVSGKLYKAEIVDVTFVAS